MLPDFYRSKKWEKFRQVVVNERLTDKGESICELCGKPIVNRYDLILHHKTELNETNVKDVNISLNPDNIMLLHFKCHNKIHERYEYFKQHVYLVYGPPCTGKSEWVDCVARQDDLIVDIDAIWKCLCKGNKPDRLKSNIFGVRDCLIDQIRTRKGKWRNAYIIGGYPLASDRERLCNLLGAEEIYIDTPQDVCLSRCKTDEMKQYVNEWFDVRT